MALDHVRLTRHAPNRARIYSITRGEVAEVAAGRARLDRDEKGSPVIAGEVAGRRLVVIIAADDPNLVIALHPED